MKDGPVIDGLEIGMLDEREHHAPDGDPVWVRTWLRRYRSQVSEQAQAEGLPALGRPSAMADFFGEELAEAERRKAVQQLSEMDVGELATLVKFRERHDLPVDEPLTVRTVDAAVRRREAERRRGAFAEFVEQRERAF